MPRPSRRHCWPSRSSASRPGAGPGARPSRYRAPPREPSRGRSAPAPRSTSSRASHPTAPRSRSRPSGEARWRSSCARWPSARGRRRSPATACRTSSPPSRRTGGCSPTTPWAAAASGSCPALGGVPRQLTPFGSNPAWSPDGTTIAFQGQSWVGANAGFSAAGEGSTLWLVPASGGEPRRLTSIEDVGPGGQGGPAWSPTGHLITFVAGTRVFSVRPDGSGLRQTGRGVWGRDVVWEKGGRSQLWCGLRQGNWFFWRVPVDPDTAEPNGEPEVLAGGGDDASAWTQPALSPDGRTMAYVTFRTRYDILAQAVSPSGRRTVRPMPWWGPSAGGSRPRSSRPTAGASRSGPCARAWEGRCGWPTSRRASRVS